MAQTFTAYYSGVAFAAGKNMAAILNGHATEILKIRRIGLLNAQTAAVTGVLTQMELRFYPATATLTAPTAITPTSHDSTNTAPTTATYGHAGTPGGSTGVVLRRIFWSSDEAAISSATSDELETYVPLNIIFDAGYGDSNVQPLTLRQNQMVVLYNTVGAAGLLDVWIEFTKE
jgi:hypothetical protein